MKTHPERYKHDRTGTPRAAFTLIEVMIVVAIVALLAIIAVPQVSAARKTSMKTSCLNNLRQLTSACQQYAFEHPGSIPDMTDLVPTYIKTTCTCPAGGTYTINGDPAPSCSLSTVDGHTI